MQIQKHTPFDRMPYDIMVGIWVGTAVSFSPTGEPVSSGLSRNIIYWHKRPTRGGTGLLTFRQDQGVARTGPVSLQGLIFAEYDLEVEGKQGKSIVPKGNPTALRLTGTETR